VHSTSSVYSSAVYMVNDFPYQFIYVFHVLISIILSGISLLVLRAAKYFITLEIPSSVVRNLIVGVWLLRAYFIGFYSNH
jgi:hypothetical protein